jgi:hypothetical protein
MTVPKVIDKLNASVAPIVIGGLIHAQSKKPPRSPLRALPNRMDAAACFAILDRIHPSWTEASIKAAGVYLDLNEIEDCLAHTELSAFDRTVFKAALAEHCLIARGVPLRRA